MYNFSSGSASVRAPCRDKLVAISDKNYCRKIFILLLVVISIMSYYNLIVMVAVTKGGAKESEDKFSHTSPFEHNLTDIFALLRGGMYADMVTKHKHAKNFITCYAGEASCSFVASKMTEITTPAHFSVAELSSFNYKALLFNVDLPEDAEKSAPKLPLYGSVVSMDATMRASRQLRTTTTATYRDALLARKQGRRQQRRGAIRGALQGQGKRWLHLRRALPVALPKKAGKVQR